MQILRTVHSKVIALVIIFFLLVLSSFLATYLTVQTHFWDENTIELVHKEISIVQELTWLALSGGSPAEIDAEILAYDQDLEAVRAAVRQLEKSGSIQGTQDIHLHIDALKQAWRKYQISLRSLTALPLQDPGRAQAEQDLRAETLKVFTQIEQLSHAVELYSSSRHILLVNIQVAFVIIAGAFTLLGYLLIRQRVLRPLSALTNAAQQIEKGDLNTRLDIPGEDEIGQLSRSFDQMREAVLGYQTGLETSIKERTAEIVTAFEFSQEIVSQLNLDQLIQSVVDRSRTLMRADGASLCLLTPDGGSVELASTTNHKQAVKKLVQPIGDNLPDVVVASNRTISSQVSSFGCSFLQHIPDHQCLSAPLHVGEQVIGAICVVRSKDQPFEEEETRAFSLLANSAAIAILNARYAEQARQLAQRAAALSERERLASELHDNLAQTLNLVNFKIGQIQAMLSDSMSETAQTEIKQVQTNVESAIEEVRLVVSEMASPANAYEEELLPQLERSVEEFEQATGIVVGVTGVESAHTRLTALAQKQLLMIISEALTNIQRHAEAENVSLHFCADQDSLHVTIEDDGKGFQPEMIKGNHHLGLRIMRTRAERSGGTVDIVSSPGKGTRVNACFPLGEGEQTDA